jgi:cell fate regulator YaaT (PSP1 superfamily)
MGCGSGGCSSGGCSTGGCNKLNTFDWLVDMQLPAHIKPYDIVEVRFKGTRKEYYRNLHNHDITNKDLVVVEMENGYDIGEVSLKGELVKLQLKKYGLREDGEFRKIIRRANEGDIARRKENKELEVPTMYKARTIALELGLSMKLSDVEYQGDKRKATFYYTAEDRVDFRELIKRLAESFKVRVEMKQIGYRQEAGRLGAIGSCGRELCCSTWLTDFKLVHTNAARYQNLSLNPLKLSGQCGRLKCCLNYELDGYMEALKDFPVEDNLVLQFADGEYKSVKTDILKRMMWFAPREAGGEWKGLTVEQVKEYKELNKQGVKPEVVVIKKELKVAVVDFQNDMGTESLTRLDDNKKPKKKNNKNRNNRNKNKPKGNAPQSNQPKVNTPQNNQPTKQAPPKKS